MLMTYQGEDNGMVRCMRLRFYICVIITSFWANFAYALDRCPALTQLFGINSAWLNVQTTDHTPSIVATVNSVSVYIAAINTHRMRVMFSGVLKQNQQIALSDLLATTQHILHAAASDDMDMVKIILRSNETHQTLARAETTLDTFTCIDTESLTPLEVPSDTQSPPETRKALELSNGADGYNLSGNIILWIAVSLAIFAIIATLWQLIFMRRRQNRRYPLYYIVNWRSEGSTDRGQEGVITDINCHGAKLELPVALTEGTMGEIQMNGIWCKARVQWAAKGSSGLKLEKKLKRADVFAIIKESRKMVSQPTPIAA